MRPEKPTHKLRRLNQPQPLTVIADKDGNPTFINRRGQAHRVARIVEHWRIVDEWWREPISRHYFDVDLEGIGRISCYHDLVTGEWFEQRV